MKCKTSVVSPVAFLALVCSTWTGFVLSMDVFFQRRVSSFSIIAPEHQYEPEGPDPSLFDAYISLYAINSRPAEALLSFNLRVC